MPKGMKPATGYRGRGSKGGPATTPVRQAIRRRIKK